MTNPVDDLGNVQVDFVWGNMPLQPDDQRGENTLDPALDNHEIATEGYNGYPGFGVAPFTTITHALADFANGFYYRTVDGGPNQISISNLPIDSDLLAAADSGALIGKNFEFFNGPFSGNSDVVAEILANQPYEILSVSTSGAPGSTTLLMTVPGFVSAMGYGNDLPDGNGSFRITV